MRRYFDRKFNYLISATLVIILTGCTNLDGNLNVSGNGRVTGVLNYSIDKSLAQAVGYSSLEVLKTKLREPEGAEFRSNCPIPDFSENQTDFLIKCEFSESEFTGDENFGIFSEGNYLVFVFKQNMTEEPNNSANLDFGKIVLDIKFASPVIEISENRTGLLQKLDSERFRLSGSASEKIDIKIKVAKSTASNISSGAMPSPIPIGVVKAAESFQIAQKNIGGIIATDLKFVKANSPYLVNSTIQIPKGRQVYVEPGVVFDSSKLASLDLNLRSTFHVQGRIYLDGSEKERIRLFGGPRTHFQTNLAGEDSGIFTNYIHVIGGDNLLSNASRESKISFKIHNSRIVGIKNTWEIVYPYGKNELYNNYFEAVGKMRVLIHKSTGELILNSNKFVGTASGNPEKNQNCWIENIAYYDGILKVINNDFSKAQGFSLCVLPSEGLIDGRSNFWGTTSPSEVEKKVLDSRDSLNYPSIIDVSSPLSETKYNYVLPGTTVDEKLMSANRKTLLASLAAADAKIEAKEFAIQAAMKQALKKGAKKSPTTSEVFDRSSTSEDKTIFCIKGKEKLTVFGKRPICPSGYKVSK